MEKELAFKDFMKLLVPSIRVRSTGDAGKDIVPVFCELSRGLSGSAESSKEAVPDSSQAIKRTVQRILLQYRKLRTSKSSLFL